ncbi:MAG: hypothetical protein U0990_01480 [Candidatus Nanopelagicales bacterium]|nr:hypothetical protein [Candidatus Nanopelagicales bacterium]MDZ4248742.1 hypothetical protein [Candidatus Nanopelagicales bacterium]
MSSAITGKQIVIALALAIGLGIIGTVIGMRVGMEWLGYSGSFAAVAYLIVVYSRKEGDRRR